MTKILILMKLAKFGICGKIFDEICTFLANKKMAFLAAKSGGI